MASIWYLILAVFAGLFVVLAVALVVGLVLRGRGPAEQSLPMPTRRPDEEPAQVSSPGFTLLETPEPSRRFRRKADKEVSIFTDDADDDFKLTGDNESR